VSSRDGKKHTGHPADGKSGDEPEKPMHHRRKDDAAAEHREYPIEYFYSCRNGDDHGHHPEESVHRCSRTHREEMVRPDYEREEHDADCRVDHGAITEKTLLRESGDDLREHA